MSTVNFESSQYVSIEFPLANAGQRLLAAIIDMSIFFIYFIVVVSFFGDSTALNSNSYGDFLWFLIVKSPWVFYNPLCEYFLHGQTLGKYILGIKLMTLNGERPGLKEVFSRWIFKGDFLWLTPMVFPYYPFFDFMTLFFLFMIGFMGIFVINFSQRKQRLADVISNTIVIKVKHAEIYNLNDILSIKDMSNHEVKYPQVIRFTDEDMMLIKNTILRLRKSPTPEALKFGRELCEETANLMGLEPVTEKRMEFLQDVLQDYVVLTR